MAKPVFTERELWSPNCHGRGGTKVLWFLLHTQEGPGTALSLGQYLANPNSGVSYHYTVDDANLYDIVDTDMCSWSVLDANPRSINLCFAGSRASWSRQEWLNNAGNAIKIAAWTAVQDCRKYGIPIRTIGWDDVGAYRPGIADHQAITEGLQIGSHTDVGPGFPWDVFQGYLAEFSNPNAPTQEAFMAALNDAEQRELLDKTREVFDQVRKGWAQLGLNEKGQPLTLVDGIAALRKDVDALKDAA